MFPFVARTVQPSFPLSFDFEHYYLRGGSSGDRAKQKSQVRSRKLEIRSGKSEVGSQKSEVGSGRSEGLAIQL